MPLSRSSSEISLRASFSKVIAYSYPASEIGGHARDEPDRRDGLEKDSEASRLTSPPFDSERDSRVEAKFLSEQKPSAHSHVRRQLRNKIVVLAAAPEGARKVPEPVGVE
jgi:hypothetical protein